MRNLFVLLAIASGLSAQTAQVSGFIKDAQNAGVPKARVTIQNADTDAQRAASSDDAGLYTIPFLQPGTYQIIVTANGFQTMVREGIHLEVAQNARIDITLVVGSVQQSVTVTEDAPLINSTDGSVSTVVDRQFVENLPMNGRSFQSLINLTPGIVTVLGGSISNTGGQFSVNGQRASANTFTVDGASANFAAAPNNFGNANTSGNLPALSTFGTTQSLVSLDALQEFTIQTSTYSAEYGRQPGGQVSIITRSGTNQLHGSAFDYLRNDVLDANDWFANRAGQRKAEERQNDFGATFGGPILIPRLYNGRNKTFFFFSYEGLRLRLPQFSLTNIPTLALRQLAPSGLQPILNAFPLPNGKDLGNGLAEFSAAYSDPCTLKAMSVRIDHAFSAKLTTFFRYHSAPSESDARRLNQDLAGRQSSRLDTRTATLGATFLLSPVLSDELRLNYSSNGAYLGLTTDSFGGAIPLPPDTLVPAQFNSSSAQGVAFLNFATRTSASIPNIDVADKLISSQRQFNVTDKLSYQVGAHALKFGLDYRRLTPLAAMNTYLMQGLFGSQQDVLNAIAGSGIITAATAMKPIFLNFSAYAQDSWKPLARLTLDLGVRWDINPAPTEATGKNELAVTEIVDPASMQLAPIGTKTWKTTYGNLAPRLGAAYRISQREGWLMVIRGGFGVFYDTGTEFSAQGFNNVFPYASSRNIANVLYPLTAAQVAPAPIPAQSTLQPPYPTINVFDPHLRLPYTFQWNVALEQALGKQQSLTVTYVVAAGRRLLQQLQLSLNKINPNFTTVNETRNSASSDYDALQAQFRRRLLGGLQALISYTWSHALDDDSRGNGLKIPVRGNADFDVRHVFAAAVTYEIPGPRGNPVTKALLKHWSLDLNLHAQSGLPADLVARNQTNPADGSLVAVRPNLVFGVPLYIYDDNLPGGRKINATAFLVPAAGQVGNFGRNQVRGLGAWQANLAARREFLISEKLKLQLRMEAFNAFNHPNFGTIQTTITAANFGQPTNMLNQQLTGLSALYQSGGPRSCQVAVKLIF